MAIDKKLIHFKNWENFISPNGVNGDGTIPSEGNEEDGTAIYGQIKGTSIVFIKDVGKIGTHGKLYGEYDDTELREEIAAIQPMISVTWSELKEMRDNATLNPGQQYRITDYVTTTSQANTQSAGHPFDIIVTADNENTLNEEARACMHEGDIYFSDAGAKLETWKIRYCLDNDAERFAGADSINGKGVIYRMIDEWGNDCPYDFKNVQFKRWKVGSNIEGVPDHILNNYLGYKNGTTVHLNIPSDLFIVDDNDYKGCYTFNCTNEDGSFGDASVSAGIKCSGNVIISYKNKTCLYLNDIVLFGCIGSYNGVERNKFAADCYSITIGGDSMVCEIGENTFGQYSKGNILCSEYVFQNNFNENLTNNVIFTPIAQPIDSNLIYGPYCQNNFINAIFRVNTIGHSFKNNKLSGGFGQNTIKDEFQENVSTTKFTLNTVGAQCLKNQFNNEISFNTFGDGMSNNIFNGTCKYATIGSVFYKNTINTRIHVCEFGSTAKNNVIGDVINCRFGALFQNNELKNAKACDFGIAYRFNKATNNVANGSGVTLSCCRFGDYVGYNNFYNPEIADGSSSTIQNLNVQSNLQGTSSSLLNIEVPANSTSEIQVAKNSKGEIKIYCEADLIA